MGDAWFIRNVADMPAFAHPRAGWYIRFEPEGARFADIGVNIHVLEPGQPNGRYHAESGQEGFLVLSGEAVVIVGDREHPLRAWDYVHCPGGTPHVFVGAGDGPCVILMVGARSPDETIEYTPNPLADRYGGSVAETTTEPARAYADWEGWAPRPAPDWPPAA